MNGNRSWSIRPGAGLLGVLCLTVAVGASGQARPRGVTDRSIAGGQILYAGKGECVKCHGEHGEGTADGASLTAGAWRVGGPSYEEIRHVIRHSGIAARGRDGDPTPMRGPTLLSQKEVRAVACYVWSISRGKTAKQKE